MKQIIAITFLAVQVAPAASISGRVFDPSGAVVPGITVRAIRLDDSRSAETQSAADGTFRVDSLTSGNHDFQVLASGFALYRRLLAIRSDNGDTVQNVVLNVGEIRETIRVEAQGKAAPRGGPTRIRVGGAIQAAKIIHSVKVAYPDTARQADKEGTVVLRAVISKDGSVIELIPMTGADRDLAVAAEAAVKQWKYSPTLLNGLPIEVATTIEVQFKLSD